MGVTSLNQRTSTKSSVSKQEVSNSDSPIFSFSIQSTIFYYFIGYVGVVSVIVLLLEIYELKQNNSEDQDVGLQQQDIIKLQIKSYPGNSKIIKENFKFLLQLSQFCYNSSSLIKRSFYFLDINVQFSFMLLIIYLIDLDLDSGKYNKVIEIIFAVTSGVAYRVLSKVLQEFARINNALKIIIYIFLEIILVTECLTITSNINNILFLFSVSNKQKNEKKFFNWLIGLAFYEILIELILQVLVFTLINLLSKAQILRNLKWFIIQFIILPIKKHWKKYSNSSQFYDFHIIHIQQKKNNGNYILLQKYIELKLV